MSGSGSWGGGVAFAHGGEVGGNRAQICFRLGSRLATITLAKNWGHCEVTDEQIRCSAFHEVCELFLGRLAVLAKERFCVEEFQIDEEVHNIIRTMENAIFMRERNLS